MLDILRTRVAQGHRTTKFPLELPVLPERFRGRPRIDHSKCPEGTIQYSQDYRLATSSRKALVLTDGELELAAQLGDQLRRILGRALRLREVCAGSCNACDLDTNVLKVHNGAEGILPVDLYIPGSPPHPLTILDGLLRLIGRVPRREGCG